MKTSQLKARLLNPNRDLLNEDIQIKIFNPRLAILHPNLLATALEMVCKQPGAIADILPENQNGVMVWSVKINEESYTLISHNGKIEVR